MRTLLYRGTRIAGAAASFVNLGGGYARETTRVYFRGDTIPDADPARFRYLGDGFGRDDRRVFQNWSPITGADPETLVIVDASRDLVRDGRHGYRGSWQIRSEVDVPSLRAAGHYFVDRERVFVGGPRSDELTVLPADVHRFRLLDDSYAADGDRVWFRGRVIAELDPSAARVVMPGLCSDGVNVFVGDRRLRGLDLVSLAVIAPGYAADRYCVLRVEDTHAEPWIAPLDLDPAHVVVMDDHHARDQLAVFHDHVRIEGADAASFEVCGGFARDRHRVYHDGTPIEGDPGSFRVAPGAVDGDYAVDRERVYRRWYEGSEYGEGFRTEVVTGADPASFVVLDRALAKDAQHVYLEGGVLAGADPATWTAIGDGYFRDARNVYAPAPVPGANVSTLVLLGDGYASVEIASAGVLRSLGDGYAVNDRCVVFHGEAIAGADASTFTSLGRGFARDAYRGYFHVLATASLEVPELHACGGALEDARARDLALVGCRHATDGVTVWFGAVRLEGLDPSRLRMIGERYVTDETLLFYGGRRVDADVPSFELIGGELPDPTRAHRRLRGCYGRDRHRLYVGEHPLARPPGYVADDQRRLLEQLDAASFRALDPWYGTDGRLVMAFPGHHVLDADPATFEVLGEGFARDARHVFWTAGYRLRDARPATFEVLGDGYARDDRASYFQDTELSAKPGRLMVLGGGYATDGASVFQGSYPVVDADVASFEVVPGWGARDRHRLSWSDGCNDAWTLEIGDAEVTLLAGGYCVLDGVVRWGSQIVSVDAASFEVVGEHGHARDLESSFYRGRPIC